MFQITITDVSHNHEDPETGEGVSNVKFEITMAGASIDKYATIETRGVRSNDMGSVASSAYLQLAAELFVLSKLAARQSVAEVGDDIVKLLDS